MKMETKKRSWVKAMTWRLVAITLLGFISYTITGSWKEMTAITLLYHGVQVVTFYFHERVWAGVSWGRIRHPLAGLPVTEELAAEDLDIIADKLRELGYID